MQRLTFLLALFVAGCTAAPVSGLATPAAPSDRKLLIDPSSMRVEAGKATLIIGVLERRAGVYSGDYRIKVFPYFFKNEKGRLAIMVSDEALARVRRGEAVTITGTATTAGKNGKTRHIEARVTPDQGDHGTLRLWFMAGDRKMIFEPAYRLANPEPAAATSP
ncbi:MAG TPA: hypothetical protein VL527_11900 [Dongiaceae bacterium]|nr:hypothetical protein [Dongiaceae bacterium]